MKKRHESIIDFPELRAQKARLGYTNADIAEMAGRCSDSVGAVLCGDEAVNVTTLKVVAAALGLRPRITFEPLPDRESDTDKTDNLKLVRAA